MIDRRDFMIGSLGTIAASSAIGAAAQAAAAGDTNVISSAKIADPKIPTLQARYAFSVSVFFKERVMIESQRRRAYVPAIGGEIWGPRLQGRVVPYGGADYGSGSLVAHYLFEASDGALIYITNYAAIQRLDANQKPVQWKSDPQTPVRPAREPPQQFFSSGNEADNAFLRFRTAPVFDAPIGKHDWLNRTVLVGHAVRHISPDHSIFNYYELI